MEDFVERVSLLFEGGVDEIRALVLLAFPVLHIFAREWDKAGEIED